MAVVGPPRAAQKANFSLPTIYDYDRDEDTAQGFVLNLEQLNNRTEGYNGEQLLAILWPLIRGARVTPQCVIIRYCSMSEEGTQAGRVDITLPQLLVK